MAVLIQDHKYRCGNLCSNVITILNLRTNHKSQICFTDELMDEYTIYRYFQYCIYGLIHLNIFGVQMLQIMQHVCWCDPSELDLHSSNID